MSEFDYLVVGAGLFGSTFAYEAAKRGCRVKVIDKRDHLGGNIYTERVAGIDVHRYGAHIFHTNNKSIWDYLNQFTEFNHFVNAPIANYQGKLYNLPFNMNTFYQLWGTLTPAEAQAKIAEQREVLAGKDPQNLEEQAITLVGTDIYHTLIKEYTKKQWGKDPKELPAFIIKRLPVRFTFDNNYFSDNYQGIPIGGYTEIIKKMLASDQIVVETEVDFFDNKVEYLQNYPKIIYSGMIDEFFDYQLGTLAYRSLRFETELLQGVANYQGNAVVNYTDGQTPYTRIIEHKHFNFGQQPDTIITKEYSKDWHQGDEAYYPINDDENTQLYKKYVKLAKKEDNVLFGGRLGTYQYLNMDQVVASALAMVKREFN
ncbi:UDP-galactopyranose mutase [Vagococcus sp. BWB3-3]|uniref:UDP-galactopyranose mutase n=1 Tax=Vagococcus allomyrinae TaxID=2794353 RepID=A0A940P9G9_9ENTE|nr:UDP-galactopyranose mutase [Vagococcus allomyrinae]MBP1042106.1 UDP-galactopyranose mutase [Vagococcus allomyrinae]